METEDFRTLWKQFKVLVFLVSLVLVSFAALGENGLFWIAIINFGLQAMLIIFKPAQVLIKNFSDREPVTPENYEELYRFYSRLCRKSNLTSSPPPLYLRPRGTPAAITGSLFFNSEIIINKKIIEEHDLEVTGALIAHELSHIPQKLYIRDFLQGGVITVPFLVVWALSSVNWLDSLIIICTVAGGAVVVNLLLFSAAARYFEIMADKKAAMIIGEERYAEALIEVTGIDGSKLRDSWFTTMVDLFRTHPSIGKRIQIVRQQSPTQD